MTDSMNFGPEWLRNLSSDGSTSGVSTGGGVGGGGVVCSRPQLADYRYGREEMLTLFAKGLRPPSSLTNFPLLYANTAQGQLPLALTSVTEDERGGGSSWTQGSSIRIGGTAGGLSSANARGSGRSISMVGTGRGGMTGVRGGRGGGGGGSGGGWTTTNHNGSTEASDWSPRKEYISGGGGGGSYRSQSVVTGNWRKGSRAEVGMDGDVVGGLVSGQGGANQDGWRQGQQIRPGERGGCSSSEGQQPQRWIQRSTSWRDGDPSLTSSTTTFRDPQHRCVWDIDMNNHQQLPEWALEQVAEPGGGSPVSGSFDATGAFHGELHKSASQQNIGGSRDRVGVPLVTSRSSLSLVKGSGTGPGETRLGEGSNSTTSQISSNVNTKKEYSPGASSEKRHSDDASVKEDNRTIVKETVSQQQRKVDKANAVQQLINGSVNGVALNKTDSFENSSNRGRCIDREDEDFDRLQEDLVLKLVVDEEPSSNNGLDLRRPGVGVGVVNHAQQLPPPPNLVLPQSDKWFYQDPQGDLQGPFKARDMAEWYRAGYFSVALLVRRGCDERFFCLGDLAALCQGGNPFQVNPLIQPPPLLLRDNRDPIQQHRLEQQQQRETPASVALNGTIAVNGPVSVNGPVAQGASAGPAPMLPDHPDLLQLQILQQQIAYRQHTAAQHVQQQQQQYNNQTPAVPTVVQQHNHRSSIVDTSSTLWASLSALQQRELLAQQLLQQQHVHHQQAPPQNPLMHIISQMQQQQQEGAAKSSFIEQQQVSVPTMPAQLPQPATQPSSQPLNPLEALFAQIGHHHQQPTAVSLPPHLHGTQTSTTEPQAPPQSTASSTNATQSANALFDYLRKQQQQIPPPAMPVQQQQPTTQLEQLAMWQKNHQYSTGGGTGMHLQHVQQQQQWRAMQQQHGQQNLQQDQSVGLWDVSTPSSQPPPLNPPQLSNKQLPLSHHSSPSPPISQQQLQHQQIPSPQPVQQQPSELPLVTSTHAPAQLQQQETVICTPSKKKKSAAIIDASTAEKKKDEEKQKKKVQTKKLDEKRQPVSIVDEKQRKKEEEKAVRCKEEKAKQRESDERKAKEHEIKRKTKLQRKVDEENRRKAEERKRLEDIERERQAARDRDENARRQEQQYLPTTPEPALPAQQPKVIPAPPAPWVLSNSVAPPSSSIVNNISPPPAASLADIQRAEREKRTLEQQQQMADAATAAALYQHQQQVLQLEREQQESKMFSWASKPLQVGKVKSLAEIQAEEHELFLKKQAEDQRLAAVKEKEAAAVPTAGIWSGQSLTWASENMPSHNSDGFWDDPPRTQKQQPTSIQQGGNRVLTGTNQQHIVKNLSTTAKPLTAVNVISIAKKPQQPQTGIKKDTSTGKNNNNNNDSTDEFSNWCSKMLANMNANVDVPTFIGFLRDIESAFDVREYCRDYLGDSAATQQFAAQFLEKRRLFKPNRSVAHKDDMCAPAPALTPNHHAGGIPVVPVTISITVNTASSMCYDGGLKETSGNSLISTDFQEVKGKGKKVKKSKMLKVDSRILGFSVTAAPDRFNVGDRDYGDTT